MNDKDLWWWMQCCNKLRRMLLPSQQHRWQWTVISFLHWIWESRKWGINQYDNRLTESNEKIYRFTGVVRRGKESYMELLSQYIKKWSDSYHWLLSGLMNKSLLPRGTDRNEKYIYIHACIIHMLIKVAGVKNKVGSASWILHLYSGPYCEI